MVYKSKLQLPFTQNTFRRGTNYTYNSTLYVGILPQKFLRTVTSLVSQVLAVNHNILFVDTKFNYNYLPLDQEMVLSRSHVMTTKTMAFFNIGLVIFLGLGCKTFIFKKFFGGNTVTLAVNSAVNQKYVDIAFNLPDNDFVNYFIYTSVLTTYMSSIHLIRGDCHRV